MWTTSSCVCILIKKYVFTEKNSGSKVKKNYKWNISNIMNTV